jgi:hypothetical protein
VSVSSNRGWVLIALLTVGVMASLLPRSALAAGGKKPAPSLNVIGFGINRLFVAKGTAVKSSSMCSEIVGGEGQPIGPPQQVYLTVFARAVSIPKKTPIQIKDSLPYGYDEVASPTLSDPFPFSRGFASGSFPIGSPPNTKNLFYEPIVSFSSEAGQYEGPSAEEFDGEYSFTVAAKVGGHTLRSTATVKVECPMLR